MAAQLCPGLLAAGRPSRETETAYSLTAATGAESLDLSAGFHLDDGRWLRLPRAQHPTNLHTNVLLACLPTDQPPSSLSSTYPLPKLAAEGPADWPVLGRPTSPTPRTPARSTSLQRQPSYFWPCHAADVPLEGMG